MKKKYLMIIYHRDRGIRDNAVKDIGIGKYY